MGAGSGNGVGVARSTGGLRLDAPAQERAEGAPGVGIGQGRLRAGHHPVHLLIEERVDQIRPLGEAAVHRAHPDARHAGDLVESHVESLRGEHLTRPTNSAAVVAASVSSSTTVFAWSAGILAVGALVSALLPPHGAVEQDPDAAPVVAH